MPTADTTARIEFQNELDLMADLGRALINAGCIPGCPVCGMSLASEIEAIERPTRSTKGRLRKMLATIHIQRAFNVHVRELLSIHDLNVAIRVEALPVVED